MEMVRGLWFSCSDVLRFRSLKFRGINVDEEPDEGVVGHAVVHDSTKRRIHRDRTGHRWWEKSSWFLSWRWWTDSRLHSGRTFGLHDPSAWQYLQKSQYYTQLNIQYESFNLCILPSSWYPGWQAYDIRQPKVWHFLSKIPSGTSSGSPHLIAVEKSETKERYLWGSTHACR